MADDPTNDNQDPEKDTSTEGGDEITLETVVGVAPEKLSDDQKTFLKDNLGELSDEQKETFKEVIEEEEEPKDVDPKKVKIETRTKEPKKPKEPAPTGDDDDEIDPEDKAHIEKVVDDKLTDFSGKLDEVQKVKDQQEVDGYIGDNPEFKIYRGVMLKYLAHPAYKNVPVKNIAAMVAAGDLQKLGAKKEREAAKKAKDTQGGGQTVRKPGKGKIDWKTASKEVFEKKKNEVMGIKA
jgi:hypothetical protein